MLRVSLVALAVALCCASGIASRAADLPHVRALAVPIDVSAQPYYALDEGFFKQHGLDVEVSSLGSGPAIIAALVSGSVDFGSGGTVSIATAHENGIPLVVVAPAGLYSSKEPTDALVVAKNSPITKPQDLVGKTVALSGLRTIAEVSLRAWLAKAGVDYNTVHVIEMPFGQMDAAVAAGRVDAADLAEPFLSASQNTRVLGQFSDAIAPQWVEGAYFCTADFAKAHPDIVKKFADAIGEASDWANTHRAESAAILERYSKATVLPTTHRALYHDTLRASDLQPVIDIAAKYGLIKKSFPAQDLFAQDAR